VLTGGKVGWRHPHACCWGERRSSPGGYREISPGGELERQLHPIRPAPCDRGDSTLLMSRSFQKWEDSVSKSRALLTRKGALLCNSLYNLSLVPSLNYPQMHFWLVISFRTREFGYG